MVTWSISAEWTIKSKSKASESSLTVSQPLWRYVLFLTCYNNKILIHVWKTTPGVKVATAILIDQELWGFFAPDSVSVEDVKAATSKVQPHYAVPTKFVSLDKFPETA